MTESFLYYLWQFQYFDKRELQTTAGQAVTVLEQGILNHNAGPDFFNASVRLGEMGWVGTVEIHSLSSDWHAHKHDGDGAYENVVLHVVWEDDSPVCHSDGTPMPTLELKHRVDDALVRDYQKLIHNPFIIPCTSSFPKVDMLIKHSMIDRAVMQRLEAKAAEVILLLKNNNNDWEETTWQLLAKNFGFKVNADAFLQLGRSLPYRVVMKHADKPLHVEALVFGQAGFLDTPAGDDYYTLLQREYHLLAHKYSLTSMKLKRAQWRFLRLRPANFPTVRLAQFSGLANQRKLLFSKIISAPNPKALAELFSVHQSEYWRHHYRFNKKSKNPVPDLGTLSVENILINTVVPLLAAWGKWNDDSQFTERASDLLQFLPEENNAIIREWRQLEMVPASAFDSQGLIELYNYFCQRRICLNCVIGASLLKPKS